MKPLGNVRGDITLQVTYNDVLGHQSLTPREPVESTPPYMYFYSIEMSCFWRPQCGKRAFLLHRKPTLSCIIFLEKMEEILLYKLHINNIWYNKKYPPREPIKVTPPISIFWLRWKNIVFWNPHCGEMSFLVQRKSTFILKEPLVKVRADIALQVKSNDFLELKSLIPREHVKGTPPLSVFDLNIRNYRLLEPPSGQNGISATSQSHFNLNWFLGKDRGDTILQVTYKQHLVQ